MKLANKLLIILTIGLGIEVFLSGLILAILAVFGLLANISFTDLIEIGLISLIPILISFFIIFKMLNKQILTPINELKNATKTIASGNLGQKMENASSDELGELAGYINMIIKNLAGALQGMSNSLRDMKGKEGEMSQSLSKLEEARKVTLQAVKDLSLERAKLMENKAKEEALLASIEDGIIATDVMGQINFINLEGLRMLGYKNEEDIIGKHFSDTIKIKESLDGPVHSAADQLIIGKTLAGSKTIGEYYFLNNLGTSLPISITSSPIIINNIITGAIILFKDTMNSQKLDFDVNKEVHLESHLN